MIHKPKDLDPWFQGPQSPRLQGIHGGPPARHPYLHIHRPAVRTCLREAAALPTQTPEDVSTGLSKADAQPHPMLRLHCPPCPMQPLCHSSTRNPSSPSSPHSAGRATASRAGEGCEGAPRSGQQPTPAFACPSSGSQPLAPIRKTKQDRQEQHRSRCMQIPSTAYWCS